MNATITTNALQEQLDEQATRVMQAAAKVYRFAGRDRCSHQRPAVVHVPERDTRNPMWVVVEDKPAVMGRAEAYWLQYRQGSDSAYGIIPFDATVLALSYVCDCAGIDGQTDCGGPGCWGRSA